MEAVARRNGSSDGWTDFVVCHSQRVNMEFPFDVNAVLPYEITILNGDYRILNQGRTARIGSSDRLANIIDVIGDASYRAQGLPAPVTTARKFRVSDHRLYLVKNASDHNNAGSVLGLLKVGEKHLYVHDSHGQVHERTPLCLLDFYVHESKQRSGYGKQLFEAMLEFEKCNAHELAVDRPSNKCLGFLQKHYHLSAPIRQVNNFVVFNAFFNRAPASQSRRGSASKQRYETHSTQDPFRRPEVNTWSLPSEKQQSRRPFSEQVDPNRNQRARTYSDGPDPLYNQRQTGATPSSEPPKNQSSIPNSYSYQYKHDSLLRDPFKSNAAIHSAPHIPRSYAGLFNENDPFPSLQRHNTNPVFSASKPPLPTPPEKYSYKDYQSSPATTVPVTSHPRRPVESAPAADSLTSLYTFPSLVKPAGHWRKSTSQPAPVDAGSSAWRLFGVHRLLN